MVQAPQKTITLDEFLQLPETKPASEYIKGAIIQKPMPQGKHSTIQGELITKVNAQANLSGLLGHFQNFAAPLTDVLLFLMSRFLFGIAFP